MQTLTTIINGIITFINGSLVPLVFAVAFIFFLWGVFRYFIAGAANEEKRKEGRQMVMYSVIGFAIMIVLWGLVNLIVKTLDVGNNNMPTLPTFGTANNTSNTNVTNTTATPSNSTNTSGGAGTPTNILPDGVYNTGGSPATQGFVGPAQ